MRFIVLFIVLAFPLIDLYGHDALRALDRHSGADMAAGLPRPSGSLLLRHERGGFRARTFGGAARRSIADARAGRQRPQGAGRDAVHASGNPVSDLLALHCLRCRSTSARQLAAQTAGGGFGDALDGDFRRIE